MTIDFDKYKDGEPITIIENVISRTYTSPRITLGYVKCIPPTNRITLDIVGEDVIYDECNNHVKE